MSTPSLLGNINLHALALHIPVNVNTDSGFIVNT